MAATAVVLLVGLAAAGASAYQAKKAAERKKKAAERESLMSAYGDAAAVAGSESGAEQAALSSILGKTKEVLG